MGYRRLLVLLADACRGDVRGGRHDDRPLRPSLEAPVRKLASHAEWFLLDRNWW